MTRGGQPKTYYTAADVEPFWRLDDKFLEKVRLRGTLGYIVKKRLAVEFIYHAEWAGSKGKPKKLCRQHLACEYQVLVPERERHFPQDRY